MLHFFPINKIVSKYNVIPEPKLMTGGEWNYFTVLPNFILCNTVAG